MFFKERAAASERYQENLRGCFWKKIFMFFKERAAASGSKSVFKHMFKENICKKYHEFFEKYRFKLIFEVNMNTVNF